MSEIVAVYVAPHAEADMENVTEGRVEAGRGIVGDRYHDSTGTWSEGDDDHRERRQITFIESEAVAGAARDYDLDVTPAHTRRNVVTSGVALNHLVGRVFRAGGVRFRGVKLCEPCGHVERVSGKKIRRALVHRGGLNAEVLDDGIIRPGDPIVVDELE